jgi:SAM-dependent methyltransferase
MSSAERIVTGSDYVAALSARASDRRYRAQFQRVTLSLVPEGSSLFDFGSGPGIDARYYAEHGREVSAYDVDPLMCDHFAAHCADFMASGAITLHQGAYRQFLTSVVAGREFPVQLVTSNFAPLNLIDDLPELFAVFDQLTVPSGAVLASVLNPYFVGDLRYRWWWRNAARLMREGGYAVPGAQARIWRRRLTDFAAQGAPHFALERVFPGNTHGLRFPAPALPLRLSTCRFMFLLFRKTH